MLVDTVMTAPVVSVDPSTSIANAAKLMLSLRISGLPVVESDGTLVGMLSEGDLLRRSELGTERKRPWWLEFLASPGKIADEYVQSHGRKVGEIMATGVVTTQRDASLEDIVELMRKHRVKRLPVVEDGKVIGIVARSDLLRALAKTLTAGPAIAGDDERIEAAVTAELNKQSWGGNGMIRVHAKDGTVELTGAIFDERARLAARVAAENIPGVKSVSDQIVSVEPMSGMVLVSPTGS
ncbi:CBS domain-containing protein [Bosea sp. BH3]|uniref:CBS domain-containing protein n=1 Tax=Bosea sp. BH3 TaxID=2871701 RepID=UPI0021CB2247|nr:CBS domain-containing protein [Bosea sp. BH3]MCU4179594.1 CBS domain-containing protein [Bosea sp. BH3]